MGFLVLRYVRYGALLVDPAFGWLGQMPQLLDLALSGGSLTSVVLNFEGCAPGS